MQVDLSQLDRNALAALVVLAAVLLAIIIERLVLTRLSRSVHRRGWHGAHVILHAVKGLLALWLPLIAGFEALRAAELPADVKHDVQLGIGMLMIATGGLTLARITLAYIQRAATRWHGELQSATIFLNLARVFFTIVTVLVCMDYLGVSVTPVLTALGVGGLAVALAMQETLSNLFAGLQLAAARQIHVGDYIRLDRGHEGFVRDITWRNTIIETIESNMVVIPNSLMATGTFINYHLPDRQQVLLFRAGVAYNSDLELVERVTREVLDGMIAEHGLAAPESDLPPVRFVELVENGVVLQIALPTPDAVGGIMVRSEFIKRLLIRYRAEGISVPFPFRVSDLQQPAGAGAAPPGVEAPESRIHLPKVGR